MTASASESNYTYTVKIYAGNQGHFTGTEGLEVECNSNTGQESISEDINEDCLVVSGLHAGDQVSFDALAGSVELEASDRYYIRGIRESGRDNSTVSGSAFTVDEDKNYVVAYGIRGEMVAYTINYQDGNGKTLAVSRTYYGNVGDQPAIAYLYIDGYVPQAYNLTKVLSANAAENVFTFRYSERKTTSGGGSSHKSSSGSSSGDSSEIVNGDSSGTGTSSETAGSTGTSAAVTATEWVTPDTVYPNEEDGTADEVPELLPLIDPEDPEDPENPANTEEENTGKQTGEKEAGAIPIIAGIGIFLLALIMLLIALLLLKERKSEEQDPDDEE
jgi:hypothetical protein